MSMTVIRSVDHGSPAKKAGVRPGETLTHVGGHAIVDVLDYKFYTYDARLELTLAQPDGSSRKVLVKKREGEDLGLNFETYLMDKARSCANQCIFCFVDQLPRGMRDTLYFKDDDARLSFLMGNYITLTNLSQRELQRIIDLRISPINVSVHTTNPDIYEFYNLGLGDPIAVSSVHGHGTGELLDACFEYFPEAGEDEEEDDVIRVAVIGKPNVGKSSLVNRILGEQRVIVSDMAGTTRDAVDSYFENEKGKYILIDTAGMRKKAKVDDRIEKFSVLRATMAIERSDVCLIMIDAQEGVTEQDTKVAGLAHEAGKACIIVVNKWDAIEKDGKTMDRMREDVRRDLSYMTYAPIVFISALTGQRVERLFELINYVNDQASLRITTGMLNSVLADATARVQPPTDKGRRLKIYYMTQVGIKPPHFVCFCNDARLFHFSYQRYLENQIRSTFGLEGTPVVLSIRQKGDKEG